MWNCGLSCHTHRWLPLCWVIQTKKPQQQAEALLHPRLDSWKPQMDSQPDFGCVFYHDSDFFFCFYVSWNLDPMVWELGRVDWTFCQACCLWRLGRLGSHLKAGRTGFLPSAPLKTIIIFYFQLLLSKTKLKQGSWKMSFGHSLKPMGPDKPLKRQKKWKKGWRG